MKTIILAMTIALSFTLPASAVDDINITITLTSTEYDAMQAVVLSPENWVQSAAKGKARKCIDRIIESTTSYRSGKLTAAEKKAIVDSKKFEAPSDARQRKPLHKRIIK